MNNGETKGHLPQGRVIVQGLLGNDDPRGVHGEFVGHVFQAVAVLPDFAGQFVVFFRVLGIGYNLFHFTFGQTKHFTQLPHNGAKLEGIIRADKGRVVPTIPFEDVIQNKRALIGRKIDIKIGRRTAVLVDETFKVEVQANRVHVGDANAVGHDAVGPTPSAHMKNVAVGGVFDQVPHNEEVGRKAHLVNEF